MAFDTPHQITAYLDERLLGKLKSIAAADDRSISWLIAQAAREFIAKPENVAKWSENKSLGTHKSVALSPRRKRATK